jgi:hypothetical protein
MPKPLPPRVQGPILTTSPAVQVSSVLANATVTLLAAGAPVGSTSATANGSVWVPVSGALAPGQSVTATQQTSDGTSDPSPTGVPVLAVPSPLPSPVFESPMSVCMSQLRMGGLVPGAEITILVDGDPAKKAVQTKSAQTDDVFGLSASVLLPLGSRLMAVQRASGLPPSPTVTSLKLEAVVPPEGPLPAPGVAQPLSCGMTSLQLFGMVPAATFEFQNGGNSGGALNVATAYTAWGAPPLKEGPFEAKQTMPRCRRDGTKFSTTVLPAPPPGPPTFACDICPDVGRVKLKGLMPGARLTLLVRLVDNANPAHSSETPFGDAGVSGIEEDFYFDAAALAPPAGKTAMLTARMTMCNTVGPDSAPARLVTAGPISQLTFGAPLFDCARFVLVKGAHVGALLQPFLDDGVTQIGDAILADNSTMRLGTWLPLQAGKKVIVKQTGCGADATIGPERVQNLPNPLPVPRIVGIVRPGATLIDVEDTIPGAMVHLLVNGAHRVSIEAPDKRMQIPPGLPALADKDKLWAVQTLCNQMSSLEGVQTVVTRGTMLVTVAPQPVTRTVKTSVTISAKDSTTNAAIIGAPVTLGGAGGLSTGTPFDLVTAGGTASPIPGVVHQAPAYADAPFGVNLVNPPPPPPATWKLTLRIGNPVLSPGTLQITSASWSIKPAWGGAALSASGVTTTVSVPKPPAGTPAANQRVDVTLSCQATASGAVNGYLFSGVLNCQIAGPNPVGVGFTGSNLASGWLAMIQMPVDSNGNPTLVVVVEWISTVPN